MYLVKQIPENTGGLEFKIELYLVKQIPENTGGYTWIGTDLKLLSEKEDNIKNSKFLKSDKNNKRRN